MTLPRPLGMLAFLAAHLAPEKPVRTRAAASRLVFFVHHRDVIGRHIIIEHSPALSRAAGWSADHMIERLAERGFRPHALRAGGGVAAIAPDELRGFSGVIDIVWARGEARGVELADRDGLSLEQIAEQNSRVKAP